MRLHTNGAFLKSAARDFKRTGAIAPSSRLLATSMIREMLSNYKNPITVLEVGGGTGSITREIARHLSDGDQLDVFEIDHQLATVLRRRLKEDPDMGDGRAIIRVHNKPIEEISLKPKYDFIISCLPFTNFQPLAVRRIFEIYRTILKPGGICSFYEYMLLRKAAFLMSTKNARERCSGVSKVVREYLMNFGYKKQTVFRNLPPAKVYHIRFD